MKKLVLTVSLAGIALTAFAGGQGSPAGEILYNGIKLPQQWPPRYDEPSVAASMPVPYLENKPEVIPVNIGRQLFVDNFLISETNLQPVYHTTDFYTGNPVMEPTSDWQNTI